MKYEHLCNIMWTSGSAPLDYQTEVVLLFRKVWSSSAALARSLQILQKRVHQYKSLRSRKDKSPSVLKPQTQEGQHWITSTHSPDSGAWEFPYWSTCVWWTWRRRLICFISEKKTTGQHCRKEAELPAGGGYFQEINISVYLQQRKSDVCHTETSEIWGGVGVAAASGLDSFLITFLTTAIWKRLVLSDLWSLVIKTKRHTDLQHFRYNDWINQRSQCVLVVNDLNMTSLFCWETSSLHFDFIYIL